MKQITLMISMFVWAASAYFFAQTVNDQLTDQSEITVTDSATGRKVTFSLVEARTTYSSLWERIDPARSENRYYPAALKEKLSWLKQNAYIIANPFAPNIGKNGSITQAPTASASYCTIPGTPVQDKPCVNVYISMVMLDLRLVHNLVTPDERFTNTFALALAHEAVHLERGREVMSIVTQAGLKAEEIRTWHKVMRDMVAPLRAANRPVDIVYENLDDLIKACGYKLPCKKFEDHIGTYQTVQLAR